MKEKLRLLGEISIFRFIYYNFFSKKIERKGQGYFVPYKHAVIDIRKGAKVIIYDASFHVNFHKPRGSKAEAYLKMLENSVLVIHGQVVLNYKATIELHQNAKIEIGSAYINTGAVILAENSIQIGYNNLISREVFIFDSDHHDILNEEGEKINVTRPVILEDDVWIGLKCTILRGSKIGKGAVVAANSLVGGKIREGTMASGNPARSYSEIKWR